MYDFLAFLGPNKLSKIERCPYYRGVGKGRLDCNTFPTNGLCLFSFTDDCLFSNSSFF